MSITSVWQRKHRAQFQARNTDHEGRLFSIFTAEGAKLDELGKGLGQARQTQRVRGAWHKSQPDEHYRQHLMHVVEERLDELEQVMDSAFHADMVERDLNRIARALGTKRGIVPNRPGTTIHDGWHEETSAELYKRLCTLFDEGVIGDD